jgi:protein-disulfide isomerase
MADTDGLAGDEPATEAPDNPAPPPPAAAEPATGDDAEPAGRRSVAVTRRPGSNRLTYILGGASIIAIIVVIVVGFWMNARATSVPDDGYGASTASTASVDDAGLVTVAAGSPPVVLDLYEDALCAECAQFDAQFGQQMAKAVDRGALAVRYHFVDFMNPASHSGNYSTRAYAALLTVARDDGDRPGLFLAFHDALFNSANQPDKVADGARSDLGNRRLADLAGSVGASRHARRQIADGHGVHVAARDAKAHLDRLNKLWADVGADQGRIPTVAHGGHVVSVGSVHWLTDLLAAPAPTG